MGRFRDDYEYEIKGYAIHTGIDIIVLVAIIANAIILSNMCFILLLIPYNVLCIISSLKADAALGKFMDRVDATLEKCYREQSELQEKIYEMKHWD